LTSITIPSGVTSIGNSAFYNASSLTSVTFSGSSSLTSIGDYAFYNASRLTSITIPSGVTSIGNSAFYNASSLASVTFSGSSSLTSIDDYAFRSASSLTSITIPSGVTSIGASAFRGASSLSSVRFLGNAPTVGSLAFSGVSVSGMVYRFASATGFGVDFTALFYGLPQAPVVLPPATLLATAGDASVTISITTPPSLGPPPSSYTISAVSDATKTCVITSSTGSCTISGLTNGTPYTFTAIAHTTTPAATSIASDPSNQVTPTAPTPPTPTTPPTPQDAALLPPAKPTSIIWSQGLRTFNQPITSRFTAAANTTYTITASSDTARSFETRATRTARGTCKITTNKKTKKRTAKCTIRLKKAGIWLVAITPVQNGIAGTPATKTIKIQAATKKARTLPTHQRQILAHR
jgi:hypothetical protein